MLGFKIRCSALGPLMTEPKTKAEGILSKGAKTYIRQLVAEEIFGVSFSISSKYMEKGIVCEQDSINLLNRVRGVSLQKNTERRSNKWITGECDLWDESRKHGHDIKTSWSLQTFPILPIDCEDKNYYWQMQGYMDLWGADSWSVDYVMVDTPDELIKYESRDLHIVGHIPEQMRITTWHIERSQEDIDKMHERVEAAEKYAREVVSEFDKLHT